LLSETAVAHQLAAGMDKTLGDSEGAIVLIAAWSETQYNLGDDALFSRIRTQRPNRSL